MKCFLLLSLLLSLLIFLFNSSITNACSIGSTAKMLCHVSKGYRYSRMINVSTMHTNLTPLHRHTRHSAAVYSSSSSSSSSSPSSLSTLSCNNKKSIESVNLKGLKAEVSRIYLRTFKKIDKANEKLRKITEVYNAVVSKSNPTLEELESCQDSGPISAELQHLQGYLTSLAYLEEELKTIRSVNDSKFKLLYPKVLDMDISDTPPLPQERGPAKIKGPIPGPRKPYIEYTSFDNLVIRVGRGASDNDELTCNPIHRDNDDYWLHVSGFPGSHVVIRYTSDDIFESKKETILDACLLAAVKSKAPQSKVTVSVTRPRHITKPSNAKAGLVHLHGDVRLVVINVKSEGKRLERLQGHKT